MRPLKRIVTVWLFVLVVSQTPAFAQVVQLPSVHTFSYSGSVLVPDSGSAFLGGRSSYAAGAASRPGSSAMGSQGGSSAASVHATIIDLEAMDREILGFDPRQRRVDPSLSADSVSRGTEEGKELVRFARSQYRLGNRRLAFEVYQMALEILPSDLRDLAVAEMRRVFPADAVRMASARTALAD